MRRAELISLVVAVLLLATCRRPSAQTQPPVAIDVTGPGPLTVTSSTTVTPTAQVALKPGASIAAAISANPAGTRFTLACGVYNFPASKDSALAPKAGDSFVGAGVVAGAPYSPPCAELNGANPIGGFAAAGTLWKVTLPASQVNSFKTTSGSCDDGTESCLYVQDLFLTPLNDTYLMHSYPVQRTTSYPPKAWEWFLDLAGANGPANTLYLGQNPAKFKVELSYTQQAFVITQPDVTVQNLTIDKFATPNQKGALAAQSGGVRAQFRNNWVAFNHGEGIKPATGADGAIIDGNEVIANGQGGIMSGSAGALTVTANRVEKNGYTRVNQGFEAGGTKFAAGTNDLIQNNFVACNKGTGLWSDTAGKQHKYWDNVAEFNFASGLSYEISDGGDLERNRLNFNGQAWPCQCIAPHEPILMQQQTGGTFTPRDVCVGWEQMSPVWNDCVGKGNGFELWQHTSTNVVIKYNRIESNCSGIRVTQDTRQQGGPTSVSSNVTIVHGNPIYTPIGFDRSGTWTLPQPSLFDYNEYDFDTSSAYTTAKPWSGPVAGNPTAAYQPYNWTGWQASGQDAHGSVR